ncbi:hypothetical protein PR048_029387 [Dryococelus australis]|uniref:Uncharacterized protein n=1 Tax=Dryococelus australis TaxID=614101 RepID=A0ABQ9GDB0_9NEOP|nr:hypothetical protein PR048_029387 [Dryococelus australis]
MARDNCDVDPTKRRVVLTSCDFHRCDICGKITKQEMFVLSSLEFPVKFYFQDIPPPHASKARPSLDNYTEGTTHRIPEYSSYGFTREVTVIGHGLLRTSSPDWVEDGWGGGAYIRRTPTCTHGFVIGDQSWSVRARVFQSAPPGRKPSGADGNLNLTLLVPCQPFSSAWSGHSVCAGDRDDPGARSCDNRTQHLPRRRHRGANPRPSDYKSATLPLSYEGRAFPFTYNSHLKIIVIVAWITLTAAETIIFLLPWRRELHVESALFVSVTRNQREYEDFPYFVFTDLTPFFVITDCFSVHTLYIPVKHSINIRKCLTVYLLEVRMGNNGHLREHPPVLVQWGSGGAVARVLASHQGDPGSIPGEFRMWGVCWTTPLAIGFSRSTPVSPTLAFQRHSILGEVRVVQRRNKAGGRGDPRKKNPPTGGIVRRAIPTCENPGVARPGIEPFPLVRESSSLTTTSPWPPIENSAAPSRWGVAYLLQRAHFGRNKLLIEAGMVYGNRSWSIVKNHCSIRLEFYREIMEHRNQYGRTGIRIQVLPNASRSVYRCASSLVSDPWIFRNYKGNMAARMTSMWHHVARPADRDTEFHEKVSAHVRFQYTTDRISSFSEQEPKSSLARKRIRGSLRNEPLNPRISKIGFEGPEPGPAGRGGSADLAHLLSVTNLHVATCCRPMTEVKRTYNTSEF